MIGYLSRRVFQAGLAMLAAVVLVFVAVRMLPGNPVVARFGERAIPEQIAQEMARHGWDQPIHRQLAQFARDITGRGDLGESFMRPGVSVTQELRQKLPATLELALAALLIAIPLGIAAGVAAAVWRGQFPDYLCMTGALLGVSVPVFFLGICLLTLFTEMPTRSRLPIGYGTWSTSGFVLPETLLRGRFDLFLAALRHLCLPAIALSTIPMAVIARMTRSSMLEVLSADYVRTARAKGNSRWRVVLCHAFPNAALPVANIAGYQVAVLLTGAVLTETVFGWPGLGKLLVDAVRDTDYAVVQGGALVVAGLFVTTNLALDLFFFWLDPRIRL